MIISNSTISILKNFSVISPSKFFRAGSLQRVLSPAKSQFAVVELEDEFPRDFGIYDLSQFVTIVDSLKTPHIEFEDTYCIIHDGDKIRVKYNYCNFDNIKKPQEEKDLPSVDVDVSVDFTKEVFDSIQKLANVLGFDNLLIKGENGEVKISTVDIDDSNSNQADYTVGQTEYDFKLYTKLSEMKMIPGDYDLLISKRKRLDFKSKKHNLTYYFSCEKNSYFGA